MVPLRTMEVFLKYGKGESKACVCLCPGGVGGSPGERMARCEKVLSGSSLIPAVRQPRGLELVAI